MLVSMGRADASCFPAVPSACCCQAREPRWCRAGQKSPAEPRPARCLRGRHRPWQLLCRGQCPKVHRARELGPKQAVPAVGQCVCVAYHLVTAESGRRTWALPGVAEPFPRPSSARFGASSSQCPGVLVGGQLQHGSGSLCSCRRMSRCGFGGGLFSV